MAAEKAQCVCEYWFRNTIGINDHSTVHLSHLVTSFVGSFDQEYEGKFIALNCGRGMEVVDDQQVRFFADSAGGAYKSAKLDTPIETASNYVYSWQIAMDAEKGSLGGFDVFGVVSDQCNNIGSCPWGGLIDIYGISASGNVWKGTTRKFQKDAKYTAVIRKREVIRMELDCTSSHLKFVRVGVLEGNDEVLYEIELPERDSWYPAIALGFPSWKMSARVVAM